MKELILHCPEAVVVLLHEAIQHYAYAAYPPGGSECAQSARESLLMTAEKLKQSYDARSGTSKMSRRSRSHVKAAVDYYFEQAPNYSQTQQQLINSVLAGEAVTEVQWQT